MAEPKPRRCSSSLCKPSVKCTAAVICAIVLVGASCVSGQITTATPIRHVVFIMMENHSFDNIFGIYPFPNLSSAADQSGPDAAIQRPINLLSSPNLSDLSPVPKGQYATADPNEGYSVYHADWNHGRMNGFAANSGSQSMTYFTPSQLAIEWDFAEEYSIGDMYFSSYLSETAPNRLMSLAGYTPVTADYGPPPYLPVNNTIFGELSKLGVSWGYYVPSPSGVPYPLTYFQGISSYSGHLGSIADFEHSLMSGSLPSVSWVMPLGGTISGLDQHPSSNVTTGELWMAKVVSSVMGSPYWNSTAIFITYDEGGGYYDQVPPPNLDGNQLGFRVPLIVISPYAKEDYVSNSIMNHDSLLAFVDYNWGLPALNQFVADSTLPLDMFDFNQSYPGGSLIRMPLEFSNDSAFPLAPQISFGSLPYSRTGSDMLTLAALGRGLYTQSTSTYTPIYETPEVLVAVFAALVIALVALRRRINRHGPPT